MIVCPHCHSENKDDAVFCVMCKNPMNISHEEFEETLDQIHTKEKIDEIAGEGLEFKLFSKAQVFVGLVIILIMLGAYFYLKVLPSYKRIVEYESDTLPKEEVAVKPELTPEALTEEQKAALEAEMAKLKEEARIREYARTMGNYSDIIEKREEKLMEDATTEVTEAVPEKGRTIEYYLSGNYVYYILSGEVYRGELTEAQLDALKKSDKGIFVEEEKKMVLYIDSEPYPGMIEDKPRGKGVIIPKEARVSYKLVKSDEFVKPKRVQMESYPGEINRLSDAAALRPPKLREPYVEPEKATVTKITMETLKDSVNDDAATQETLKKEEITLPNINY